MAVLDRDHTHLFPSNSRSTPSEAFCVVQFVLFWVGFFVLSYVFSLLIGLVVS